MSVVPFFNIVGDRALRETRVVTVSDSEELPAGSYGFFEFYCDDPKCDCRRVIFQVRREDTVKKTWATISYGWDTPAYYAKWCGCGMGDTAEEMASATLEPFGEQTELSESLLDLFCRVLLQDAGYVERLRRHYGEACPKRAVGVGAAVSRTPRPFKKRRRR